MSCHSSVSSMSSGYRPFVVKRLDGVDQDVSIDKKANGMDLLDKVCKTLGLLEKEYFGLQYVDKNGDHLWVNLRNPLMEQLPQGAIRPTVEMRVKYFVSPQKLMQPITRIQFYKHLRKDLILGRLRATSGAKAARLTAFIAQVDKGDYHLNFKYGHKVPCSSSDMDSYDTRIRREHHKLSGTPGEVAIENFLNEASNLEHYGVEMHEAVSSSRSKMIVGVGPEYILIMSPQMEVFDRYHYDAIQYTAFHARKFTAMVVSEDGRVQLEYELKSRASAQALYRSVTEFHTFFQQDKVSNVIKNSGYCKSVFGSFKGQSPDRFYFDVTRTHQEVVDHLWPILHPNLTRCNRPLPPISSGTYHDSSSMSIASQRSTRSLPANSPHNRGIRSQGTLQRSISTDNNFSRRPPPPCYPPSSTTIRGGVVPPLRRDSDVTQPRIPPSSPFFPYASTIDANSDTDEQNTYISGTESDTYVCMRSLRESETYSGAGSDTYVNSGASEVSSSSLENRIPSPPPVYSEVDPNSEMIPSPPPRMFPPRNNFTISGVLDAQQPSGFHEGQVFNFEPHDRVLARTRELESELNRLRSSMTCRMCRNNSIGATFCPCGHTICCISCAQKLKQCFECDVPIDSIQKIVLT